MSGKNEEKVIKLLNTIGYKINDDFVRQYPIGGRFVLDFAFRKEQVAIEVDGKNHESKKQKAIDKQRDRFLRENNWAIIRIRDKDLFGSRGSFFKFLIMYVVKERREQWESGRFREVEVPEFEDINYED